MRAILADRDPTVRGALRALGTQCLDMHVVAEAGSAADLEREVDLHYPDLVVVAWDLIDSQADTLLAALHGGSAVRRVVVLGLRPESRAAAIKAGADGYISLVDAPDVVARVLQGRATDRSAADSNEPGSQS